MEIKREARTYISVFADITNYCNARCVFCCNDWTKSRSNCDMDEEIFDKAIQLLPLAKDAGYLFSCLYEPTLNKNFSKYLSCFPYQFREKTSFTTNLARALDDSVFFAMAHAHIDHINISLETFNEQLYYKLMGIKPTHFYRNLNRMFEIFNKSTATPPKINFITMVLRDNYDELVDIAKTVQEKYPPFRHMFRLPFTELPYTEVEDNIAISDKVHFLTIDEIKAVRNRLLSVSENIHFSTTLSASSDNFELKINSIKNRDDKEGTKKKLKSLYMLRVMPDGKVFLGDETSIDLCEISSPFAFFSRKLTELQVLESSFFTCERAEDIQMQKSHSCQAVLEDSVLYDDRFLRITGSYKTQTDSDIENLSKLFIVFGDREYLVNIICTDADVKYDLDKIIEPDANEFYSIIDLYSLNEKASDLLNTLKAKLLLSSNEDNQYVNLYPTVRSNSDYSHLIRNKDVYIYGTGILARECYHNLQFDKTKFHGFIVSDGQAKENQLLGYNISCLSDIPSLNKDFCVIVASKYWFDIIPGLEKKGFSHLLRWKRTMFG